MFRTHLLLPTCNFSSVCRPFRLLLPHKELPVMAFHNPRAGVMKIPALDSLYLSAEMRIKEKMTCFQILFVFFCQRVS